MNSNQRKMAKGYGKIAQKLGSLFGLYRVCDYTATCALDPRNWMEDRYFCATKEESFQKNSVLGLNELRAYVDFTDLQCGDIFHDADRNITYFIGDIRDFEMPLAIQCFNTFTAYKRTWDKTTRSNIETNIADTIPCNIQNITSQSFQQTPDTYSNDDHTQQWSIQTWLPQGTLSLNDELRLDSGHNAQITDIFYGEQGLTIKCKQIRNNPVPIV